MKAPDPTTIDNRYRGPRLPGFTEPSQPLGGISSLTPDPEFQKTHIPTYSGNSKYGSIMDDYYQSEMFDRDAYFNVSPIQPTVSIFNPLFGGMGPGQMSQMGNFNDFLKSNYESMLSQMPSKVKRSQEYMDKMDLYGDAYNKMGFGNPSEGLPGTGAIMGPGAFNPYDVDPEAMQQLLGPDGNPMPIGLPKDPVGGPKIPDPRDEIIQKMPFDQRPGGNNFSPTDVPLFGEQEDTGVGMPVGTDTTDSFGIGSNPIMNNPIAPMPSMPTAPNTQPGHSHDDLLSGIGKLFEQYFPQQGSQQINQPATQPIFDAAGNSAPQQTQSNQVFGNMITPNFGGGY